MQTSSNHILRFFICLVLFFYATVQLTAQVRTKTNFGAQWLFTKDSSAKKDWSVVNIPHTAAIEKLVVINQFQGVCHYKKTFQINAQADKKQFIYFEGVMMEADVFINGKWVTNHKGGYLPFTIDISAEVIPNTTNTIELTVKNTDNPEIPPGKPLKDLDFNYYGGIYRNVYLITTNKLYVTDAVAANKKASGGLFVHFDSVSQSIANGYVQVHIKNEHSTSQRIHLKTTVDLIHNKHHRHSSISANVHPYSFSSASISLAANQDTVIMQAISMLNPKLWSPSNPQLYRVAVDVVSGEQVWDRVEESVGIRSIAIEADGFYLNGKRTFISGTNRHQEYPYIGYALSDEAQYRDAVKIKNAGFDFVRCSHYPPATAFLNACDELGIMVMNSLPGWQFFGNDAFQATSLQNLRDMIRRDRNHPSIIFWENSLNETAMTDGFMLAANAILDEEIPFRNTIGASWLDNAAYELFIPARQHAKAPDYWTTYNQGNRKLFIAEYGDWEYYAQNAGFNQTTFANLKAEERTSRQLRAFGEKRLLQQAFNFQEGSNSNRKGKQTIGEANWLMFDYNRGYSPDIESSGISDIFRIPKFAYYFYQSQQHPTLHNDNRIVSGPMVSIASNWNAQSPTDIRVFSNCESVALYLNDSLINKINPTINSFSDALPHPPFVFSIHHFIEGELKAVGYINGKAVSQHVVQSTKEAKKINLSVDISGIPIHKTQPDIVFVYARIVDEKGNLVTDANNEITFKVNSKHAALIGMNPIKAEAGIATILLKTNGLQRQIILTASSPALTSAVTTIK